MVAMDATREEHIYMRVNGRWMDVGSASEVRVQEKLAEGVPWKRSRPEEMPSG